MKIIFKIITYLFLTLLYSCYDDEGAYDYRGYTLDNYSKNIIDSVECRMYIIHNGDESLYTEVLSDSAGYFNLNWSGLINKNDARITFNKKGYEIVKFEASFRNNELFNDTVFLKRE